MGRPDLTSPGLWNPGASLRAKLPPVLFCVVGVIVLLGYAVSVVLGCLLTGVV